jgi:hypothetical protein
MEKVFEFVPLGMPRSTSSSTFSGAAPRSKCSNLCPSTCRRAAAKSRSNSFQENDNAHHVVDDIVVMHAVISERAMLIACHLALVSRSPHSRSPHLFTSGLPVSPPPGEATIIHPLSSGVCSDVQHRVVNIMANMYLLALAYVPKFDI